MYLDLEFLRQVDNLVLKGYPKLAGLSERTFRKKLQPLKSVALKLNYTRPNIEKGTLPFVLVIAGDRISPGAMMRKVKRAGRRGIVAMKPCRPDQFSPIKGVVIPGGLAYIISGVDRGRKTLNVRPEDALKSIRRSKRSPLTIHEGIAIVTHFPDFLMKNHCFSLLASRRADQRVPAIWISGSGSPKLGWCWDRNPHTWLGSGSCKSRVGATRE